MISFKVIEKCWQDAKDYKGTECDFYLEKSNWDDYGYRTTYCLHATKKLTGLKDNIYLGIVKIMRKGQTTGEAYLLSSLFGKTVFNELPEDFVSLSFSLEIFNAVNRYLPSIEGRNEFIHALHLILGEDSKYYEQNLEEDPCFKNSLLRDGSRLDAYELQKGRQLLFSAEVFYNLRKESIRVRFSHVEEDTELSFSSVSEESEILPNGIVVFIGKNGSGKSTAIYKLAKLLYTEPTSRYKLESRIGTIEPQNVGVNKLFIVSYSPFDNFVLPGTNDRELLERYRRNEQEYSRFVFCGIRDLKKEVINKVGDEVLDLEGKDDYIDHYLDDRQENTTLKTVDDLANEFADAMERVLSLEKWNAGIWSQILQDANQLQPSLYSDLCRFEYESTKAKLSSDFKKLSTGHKYFLHSLVTVIANIEDNCLVLFDEPENHLHPPLLSFLILSLKKVLYQNKSVMFIATHSPVVLQEVFSNNVYVVRRYGEKSSITHPMIETYGASISDITTDVFDLNTDVTNYYDSIDYLYSKWEIDKSEDLDVMLRSFEEKLGHKLSNQIESYVINRFIKDKNVDVK